jgi:hypothetical protein
MIESDLAVFISDVCKEAGRSRGIEFHVPAPRGPQVPGRWEISYRLKRPGWSVALTHWLSADSLVSEEVSLRWSFPPTPEQREQFSGEISEKLDQMLEWLKNESFSNAGIDRKVGID